MDSIKNKAIKGTIWSGVEKLSSDTIQFVVTIIMARILMPDDYGTIGVLLVFISFSSIFIEGGMTTALIQKRNRTEDDFHTAFIYNIVTAFFIYSFLFLLSPCIAQFYERNDLTLLLRVLSLTVIAVSFASVQTVYLTIKLDFRKICIVSILSGLLSGSLGIYSAHKGFGIWAIVIQQLSYQFLRSLILYIISEWHPKFRFSKKSFDELFSFGIKLVLTNFLAKTYENLYPLVIGKLYPMKILGYYTRGQQFSSLPVSILTQIFMRVSFPVMSSIKDDDGRLRHAYRTYISLSSFIVFPTMFILIIIARPLVLVVLTQKWLECVPFLQILSFGFMFNHISTINLNLLFVEGRSDLALKLELIKKTIAISIFLVSTIWGILGVCIGQAFYSLIATFLNSKYTYDILKVSYFDQIKDFGIIWIISATSCIIPSFIISIIDNFYCQIFVGIFIYISFYLMINYLFSTNAFNYAKMTFKQFVRNNNNSK